MDARTIFLDMKVLAWSIDLNGIKNKDIVKYPYPIGIKKNMKSSLLIPNDIKKTERRS